MPCKSAAKPYLRLMSKVSFSYFTPCCGHLASRTNTLPLHKPQIYGPFPFSSITPDISSFVPSISRLTFGSNSESDQEIPPGKSNSLFLVLPKNKNHSTATSAMKPTILATFIQLPHFACVKYRSMYELLKVKWGQMGPGPFGVCLFIARFDAFHHFPHFNGVGTYYSQTAALKSTGAGETPRLPLGEGGLSVQPSLGPRKHHPRIQFDSLLFTCDNVRRCASGNGSPVLTDSRKPRSCRCQ